jgi:hypothetical protein
MKTKEKDGAVVLTIRAGSTRLRLSLAAAKLKQEVSK